MSKFVVRRKADGLFLAGGRTRWNTRWVDNVSQARTYDRKCDASNSVAARVTSSSYSYRYRNEATVSKTDFEVVSVIVSVATESTTPALKFSPEVLDKATRYVLTEQARTGGAAELMIEAMQELDTESMGKIVQALYQGK